MPLGDTKALACYVARCQRHMRSNLELRKYNFTSLISRFISTQCRTIASIKLQHVQETNVYMYYIHVSIKQIFSMGIKKVPRCVIYVKRSACRVLKFLKVHMKRFFTVAFHFIIVKINIKESYIRGIKNISPFSFKDIKVQFITTLLK